MAKTTGKTKVTMEAFGEKIEQTGSAVIAIVIKPEGTEAGCTSMAVGGTSVSDFIEAAAISMPNIIKQMCTNNYDAYRAGELFIRMFREYMRDDDSKNVVVQRKDIVEAEEVQEEA